jgi:hypothetical protein
MLLLHIRIHIVIGLSVVLSRTVAPICLPAQSTDPDQFINLNAMILGWDSGGNETEEYFHYYCMMDTT